MHNYDCTYVTVCIAIKTIFYVIATYCTYVLMIVTKCIMHMVFLLRQYVRSSVSFDIN